MEQLTSFLEQDTEVEDRIPELTGAILVVDIGTVYTRAILLDEVDGMYRFVARGRAPTTATPPWEDVLIGVHQAIQEISDATGRQLLDSTGGLILPERDVFFGVNAFAATSSAGKPIRTVLVGLMPEVSLDSGKRAADSTYLQCADTFSLADRRSPEEQINALLEASPDLILMVGGTDGGAVESIRKQINTIGLACSLMRNDIRPTVLYAGNRDLQEEINEKLGEQVGMRVLSADNVRPRLDIEHLEGTQSQLATLFSIEKSQNTGGFAEVASWTEDGVFPTAHGFSRMIKILNQLGGQDILGVDLGSASTTIAASVGEGHYLNVFGHLGIGHSAQGIFSQIRPENLRRWLTYAPRNPDEVLDAVWNKWLFPQTVPATQKELEIGYALAREIIRYTVLNSRQSWRGVRQRGFLPPFGTILLSGSTLARPPHYGWSALMALDAILPVGVTRLLLDPYGLATALGAVAPLSARAVVQTLDTGAFIDLGTAISVSGRARQGEIVLRGSVKLKESGQEDTFEVEYGTIVTVPIPYGQEAELVLEPRRVTIETGQKRSLRRTTITGGKLGLIIDARGRPWRFPHDWEQRHQLIRVWQGAMIQEEQP